jgi:hypothetical protein
MHMYKRFTGITAVFFAVAYLLGVPSADAAPADTTRPAYNCEEEGYRGQPEYDRNCLTTGVVGDAGALWYSVPEGRKGRESDDMVNRRSICKYAHRHGGIKRAATELVTDMTYDSYVNHRHVNAWVVSMARVDCTRMGYNV